MGASILRLFFHDCFVNGCDGSILLDDTAAFTGEQNAFPNKNSIRGLEVIDSIKAQVEASCRATVSCADILALAARDGVVMLGGPTWTVDLGRRDARTASQTAANSDLPGPSSSLSTLVAKFAAKGLDARDMTALSGAHTIGQARCATFRSRIYNDTDIDAGFAALRRQSCPSIGGDDNLAPLDSQTPNRFGNNYYQDLVARFGLLHSDQELFSGGPQDALVRQYSSEESAFARDFATAMAKMATISPLTGTAEEIRLNCRTMASSQSLFSLCLLSLFACATYAQLSSSFYDHTCPKLPRIVRTAMIQAVRNERRMGASILRLFFHDCFVNGCDGSILLDDTATFTGEKNAFPNRNSVRGFEVIDTIKSNVEAACNATVSCADILALAARDGVFLELFNGGSQDQLVRLYSFNEGLFAGDFVTAMLKMGNISPLTGSNGQIRLNCRKVN
ncbi:peroxidase P7-like [Ananas comosus]|uniref:Peroxidase P7-like n=1 Tax=Ananas comosus TaxID=4615 RepID=A0A6P5FTQ2_ANACO|nr:peroxidase P7-like [Ananas comosus]